MPEVLPRLKRGLRHDHGSPSCGRHRHAALGASRHRDLLRRRLLHHRVASGEASLRSAFARAPLSLPRQPPSMPPHPLRRHTPVVSASPSSRLSSPRSHNRSAHRWRSWWLPKASPLRPPSRCRPSPLNRTALHQFPTSRLSQRSQAVTNGRHATPRCNPERLTNEVPRPTRLYFLLFPPSDPLYDASRREQRTLQRSNLLTPMQACACVAVVSFL